MMCVIDKVVSGMKCGILLCYFSPQSLRSIGTDVTILRLSIIVFLSYLPEAGQYSCFFLYLRQVKETWVWEWGYSGILEWTYVGEWELLCATIQSWEVKVCVCVCVLYRCR